MSCRLGTSQVSENLSAQLNPAVREDETIRVRFVLAEDTIDDTVPGETRIGKPVASAATLGAPHNQQRALFSAAHALDSDAQYIKSSSPAKHLLE